MTTRRIAIFLLLLIGLAVSSQAQVANGIALQKVVPGNWAQVVPNATVTVCVATATGNPCSPLATIYTDRTLTTPATNPFNADTYGNYTIYAPPGIYVVCVAGTQGLCQTVSIPSTSVGTVTSVGATVPTGFSVTGSPVTGSGTLAISTSGLTIGNPLKAVSGGIGNAGSTDIISLFTGCSGTQYLGADGGCHIAGGGGNIDSGNATGQLPVWVPASVKYSPQLKAIYDVRDWMTCDGVTDATAGMKSLLATIGTTQSSIVFPLGQKCLVNTIAFPSNITLDFSGGGSIQLITNTTVPGGAAFVQGSGTEVSSSATCSVSLTGVAAGNMVVFMDAPYPGFTYTFSSVTDSAGNFYSHIQQSLAGQPRNAGAWIATNVIGGNLTITATATGTLTNGQCIAHEYSGMGPSVALDGTGASSNAVTNPMSAGPATTTAGSLLIGYGGQPFTAETCTAGAGYTQPAATAGQTTNGYLCAEYLLAGAGGSTTATQNITVLPANEVYNLLPLKVGLTTLHILGGLINPDNHQIFYNATTNGQIDFTQNLSLTTVRPEWWGAAALASAATNTGALQASIYASFGCGPFSCRTNGSGLNQYNKTLFLGAQYQINDELKFYHVIGSSASRAVITCQNGGITQTANHKRIIDGQSDAYLRIDNCLWMSNATDTAATSLVDFGYSGAQGTDLKPQFIDLYGNSFVGNNLRDTGLIIAKEGGAAQGSNIYCYDCAFSGFTGAGMQVGGNNTGRNNSSGLGMGAATGYATNALAIGLWGGDIQGSPLYGISNYGGGYITVYGTSFENGFSTQTGFDFYCEATQGPCVMEYVRSESRKLAAGSDLVLKKSRIINQASYLPPGQTFPVGSVMTGSAVGGDGAYYQVTLNTSAAGGAGTPTTPIQASSGSSTTIVDTNQTIAGSTTIGTFVLAETVTQAVTGSTGTVLTVPVTVGTITGSVTTGTIGSGHTMTQAVTGVTCTSTNAPTGTQSLTCNNFSGTANNTNIWTDGTTSGTYTPTAAPSFAAANPAMRITAATGAPDNTHNWTGGTSAAVYVPTAAPANDVNWVVNDFNGMTVSILSGGNMGCYGTVTSNTATSITLSAGWITRYDLLPCNITIDTTSKFVVEPTWNHGTVVSGGMTMVYMNENVIDGCNGCGGFSGRLEDVITAGGKIKSNPRTSILKNVSTYRQDWYDSTGGQDNQLCCDNQYEWDVHITSTVSSNLSPYLGTYLQKPIMPAITGVPYSSGNFNMLGRKASVWSIGTIGSSANTSANDVWVGGRSDPGAGTDATRNILEFGGMLGRAAPIPLASNSFNLTNLNGTDTDITGGPSTGTGTGGGINFWTSNPSGSGSTVNSGLKRWLVSGAGHFLAGLDNTYDIGANGATRPRTGYFGTSVITPTVTAATAVNAATYQTATNCAASGTAANPSVVSCAAASTGAVACDVAASGGTCTIDTTAVTANSEIFVQEVASEGTRLGVTCNTSPTVIPAITLASKIAATSFTINMPTITTNPACFIYHIVN